MSLERKPSCFDCQRAKIHPGTMGSYWDPPEPPEAECTYDDPEINVTIEELLEQDDLDYVTLAERCGHFKPILVGECQKCGKEINEPEYSWPLYVDFFDRMYVCSEKCKAELEKEVEEEIKFLTDKRCG